MSGALSYWQLLKLLTDGVVCGSSKELVNGASIDIRLGPKILVESQYDSDGRDLPLTAYKRKPINLRDREQVPMNEHLMGDDGFVLHPGQFVLAHSVEIFNLPNTLAADFRLKSSAARIGLEQLSAGWCDPGWHNSVLTLELVNCTQYTPICLHAGDRIGQMVFLRCLAVPEYASYGKRGRYNNDRTVEGIKP